jgi:hypothetical protein
MTLYRKRLTSSFYAVRESLQRRLNAIGSASKMLAGSNTSILLADSIANCITQDDFSDLDDADDAIITGASHFGKSIF